MSKKKLKRKHLIKLSRPSEGSSFAQEAGAFLLGQVVPKLLEHWSASSEPADILRAIKPALFGPTVEASPDDLRTLYLTQQGELEEQREEVAARVADLEFKNEEHKHKEKTLDDLTAQNRAAVMSYLQRVREALKDYNAQPQRLSQERELGGDRVVFILGAVMLEERAVGVVASRAFLKGAPLNDQEIATLMDGLEAFEVERLAPCCEDCADGPGKCGSKLSKARNLLAHIDAQIAFWAWVLPRIPDRRAHLTLAMAAKLHGLPSSMFEGL